jgi:signal transduction histidine kinase
MDSAEARSLLPLMVAQSGRALAGDSAGTELTLRSRDESYLGTIFRLDHGPGMDREGGRGDSVLGAGRGGGAGRIFYVIIKPLSREVRQSMASILATFGFASFVFLGLTTVVGLVISRSMTRPIQRLVEGTTEISRGNYDFPIVVGGRDELGYLARRFMEMSASLKEKITLLGQLNDNLVERNRDLDETLRQLQTAQERLVRSERLAATGKLTAQLAHEINNPIHNIQSCLKTALARLPRDAKGRDLIDVAYDEADRLSRLTVQMLDFYRNAMVEEELKPVDLNALLEGALALTRQELEAGRITVRTEIEPGLPGVQGSRDKLMQVMVNLISNARDAMPGGGDLVIAARARDGAVRITVRDTGVGIPRENLNRIFDAFFTTKAKVSGVGLGLSVSYGIVNLHRGAIEVESEPGRGSAFTVVLPV